MGFSYLSIDVHGAIFKLINSSCKSTYVHRGNLSHHKMSMDKFGKERVSVMYYIVQPGDSLHSIAMQYNTTVRHLMDLNPRISNPHRIHVGERIEVGNQRGLNPWRGNEWLRGKEEYQRGREEYRRGRAEYHKGREEYSKNHGR